jgi:WD40 repeat protein
MLKARSWLRRELVFLIALLTLLVLVAPGRAQATRGKVELVPNLGHSDWVYSVAFSPDGAHILSGSNDATIKLWDAATGALIRTFAGHSLTIYSVAFSPDGDQVLSGSADKTIKLWDAAAGTLMPTRRYQNDPRRCGSAPLSRPPTA